MNFIPRLIGAMLVLGFVWPVAAQTLMPGKASLEQRESQHFQYIYNRELAPQIPALAQHCEDAYAPQRQPNQNPGNTDSNDEEVQLYISIKGGVAF